MLLAGDVGATKTLLGLASPAAGRPAFVAIRSFATQDYDDLGTMVRAFLNGFEKPVRPEAASFGVAGPIRQHVAQLTNVAWSVDAHTLAREFSLPSVGLLNDLEAMANAVPVLAPEELLLLQPGVPVRGGNAALIAAGTGLGEAMLHQVNGRYVPYASEGGHADFAPRDDVEIELLRELRQAFGRVDYEHVLSGPGLLNVHAFFHRGVPCAADPAPPALARSPSDVTGAALARTCHACVRTLDLFVSVYGAEAGNHALRSVATGGVFVGGGIAPKILPALQRGGFIQAFLAKPPLVDLLAAMPVSVILNEQAALLGAAVHANRGGD